MSEPRHTEGVGTRIGPYELVEEIGSGGFGVVYRARQSAPMTREVALKIIKHGMDVGQVIARFEAERQALSLMEHENIARVLDAGATYSGRPYFVMELVDGVSITDYCRTHSLSMRDRLALFIEVCHAIQHAHQKGVIHRDLKPSNVLVTTHEGKPTPKVIDFGIAKAINQRLTERTLFTEYRQFVGTPAYMSPEQAEMSGLDVDTRSDIYALGILLYELLTGSPPLERERLLGVSYAEIQRLIREEEPIRPSTKVSTTGDVTAEGHAAIPADRLAKALRGDLDWIVMKALEKDRTRRYRTANEFAQDIERHLKDLPVLASPPSPAYRLMKLVRRNRALAATIVIVTVLLVGGTIGTAIGLVDATRAKRQLSDAVQDMTDQRNRARNAEREARAAAVRAVDAARVAAERADDAAYGAEMAEAIRRFLHDDMLSAVEPSTAKGRGRDVLVRDVLAAAARRLDRACKPGGRLAANPGVEGSLRQAIGVAILRLGQDREAEPLLRRALELRKIHHGERSRAAATSATFLAEITSRSGRLEESVKLQTFSADVYAELRPDSLDHWESLANLASVLNVADRPAEALDVTDRALKRLRGSHRRVAICRVKLLRTRSAALIRLGRGEEGRRLVERAATLARETYGPDHPMGLAYRVGDAERARVEGRLDESERILMEVLRVYERFYGKEHPQTMNVLAELSKVYRLAGQYPKAEATARRMIRVLRKAGDPDHARLIDATASLAATLYRSGKRRQALKIYQSLWRQSRDRRGADHRMTLGYLSDVGGIQLALGDIEQARTSLERACTGLRRALGPTDSKTLRAELNYAEYWRIAGETRQSIDRLHDVLRIALNPDTQRIGLARIAIKRILMTVNPMPDRDARSILQTTLEIVAGDAWATGQVRQALAARAARDR